MGFLKQLGKDTAKEMHASAKVDFKVTIIGFAVLAVGVAIGLLGVMLGGTFGNILVLVGLVIAAIGGIIVGGLIP